MKPVYVSKNHERAMVLAGEVYRLEKAGELPRASEGRQTIDDLVGSWADGKFTLPSDVKARLRGEPINGWSVDE